MKRRLITGLLTVLAMTGNAQSFKEWTDPEVNAVIVLLCMRTTLLMNQQMPLCRVEKNVHLIS